MENATTEETSSSETNYSDSFVASDEDLEDVLTWDSGDSRPAAPSPPPTPSVNMSESPVVSGRMRLRPRRRRPVIPPLTSSEETQATDDESVTVASNLSPEYGPAELSPLSGRSEELGNSVPYDVTSPPFSPRDSTPPLSSDNAESEQSRYSPRSPSISPPPTNRSNTPDIEYYVPHSPDYSPPVSEPPAPPIESIAEPTVDFAWHRIPVPEEAVAENQPVIFSAANPTTTNTSVGTVQAPTDNVATEPLNSSTLSEGDDNSLCSICMDPLTNSGKHRVVCLKCGHIFGNSCLERWIKVGCNGGARRCPTCNKKACLKDIRILFLPKVVPLDTVEKDRLIQEKEEISAQKKQLEMELSRCQLKCDLNTKLYEEKIKVLETKYSEALDALELLNQGRKVNLSLLRTEREEGAVKTKLLHSLEISKDGNCRVLAFSYLTQELLASQPSGNTVFAGYGVRVMNTVDFQPTRFMFLHQKPIRDLAFHPEDRNLLLSVSLDQTAKLVDLANCATVHTFKGEGALWSCCWELSNPHLMLVGSQLGRVRQYDRRMMSHFLNQWENKDNPTPVVALASAPCVGRSPFPQGGFFSCRLKGVYAFARNGDEYNSQELPLEGVFTTMRYDYSTQSLLTMTRPSSQSAHVKVNLNLVDVDTKGNICTPQIHTFNNGSSARVLSRMTTVPVADDSLIVAHHESGRTMNMWSSKSGNLVHSIPIKEPVLDVTSVPLYNNKCLLASLSDKRVNVYSVV